MASKPVEKSYIETLEVRERKRYEEKIGLIGGRDPYSLNKNDLVCDERCLPAVTYIDIINYLINAKSAYTFEQLKAYKSLDAINQLCSGWVQDVRSLAVNDHVLVAAKVRHSQQMNASPLHPWIIAAKDGIVAAAHCDCKAGFGETCSHVGALLFHIEATHRLVSRRTVTQEKAYWPMPAAVDKVPFAEVRNIDFTSVATKKRRLDDEINGEDVQERSSQKLPDVPELTREERHQLLTDLYAAKTRASVLAVSAGFQDEFVPEILQDGKLPQVLSDLYEDRYMDMSPEDLRKHCISLADTIVITSEQALNVERLTRDQNKCKEWSRFRQGRITASNMKSVCTTTIENPAVSTVQTVCGSRLFKSKATEYGLRHEKEALARYETEMKKGHINFSVTKNGLFINPSYPHLGATPDGITKCDCCGEGLVEIKCPYSGKDKGLSNVDYIKDGKLKDGHQYQYQIQTQLTVTQMEYCDFVVWTPSGIHIQRTEPNQQLEEEILAKSWSFFVHVVLPELTGHLISRENLQQRADRAMAILNETAISQAKCKAGSQTLCMDDINGSCGDNGKEVKLVCLCGKASDMHQENTVKCANENCQFGYLHFKCISIKRKPKPPYYCPTCRKVMWK